MLSKPTIWIKFRTLWQVARTVFSKNMYVFLYEKDGRGNAIGSANAHFVIVLLSMVIENYKKKHDDEKMESVLNSAKSLLDTSQ